MAAAIAEVESMLANLDAEQAISVIHDLTMSVDDYLVTRIVEMVIHLDDIEVSVGQSMPRLPGDAIDLTLATCVEVAAIRNGHTALLRALTRRERVETYPHAF